MKIVTGTMGGHQFSTEKIADDAEAARVALLFSEHGIEVKVIDTETRPEVGLGSLGLFADWEAAFDKASELLAANQLTAITIVTQEEWESGQPVARVLAELGDPETVLTEQRMLVRTLYAGRSDIHLYHGLQLMLHPWVESNEGWMLVMAYSD